MPSCASGAELCKLQIIVQFSVTALSVDPLDTWTARIAEKITENRTAFNRLLDDYASYNFIWTILFKDKLLKKKESGFVEHLDLQFN